MGLRAMRHWLDMLVPTAAFVLYLASALWLVRGFTPDERRNPHVALVVAFIAALLHAGAHLTDYRESGAIDLHFYAALSLVGVALATLTIAVALRRPVAALGIVVFPVAGTTLLLYALAADPAPATLPSWQIQLHAWLALFAFATLALAALVAIMLYLQERALRRRQLAAALRAFPPLTLLEALLFRLLSAGFALLTLALLCGVVFVENLFIQHLMHKTVLSLLAWIVFGTLLFGRLRYGWRGRRAVRMTLVAMGLLVLAFFGSKFVIELVLHRGA